MSPQEYELVIAYKCNWNCSYCAVDTHKQKELTKDEVISKIQKIEPKSNVTLSGGELGLCKKEYLLEIIQLLKEKECNLALNTNGLFIKRYPDLLKEFEYVLYHCSENLTEIEVLPDEFDSSYTQYMIVVDDNNFINLRSFLEKYSFIKFDIVPSTMPEGINNTILSYKNRIKILTTFHKYMTDESKKYILKGRPYDITYL